MTVPVRALRVFPAPEAGLHCGDSAADLNVADNHVFPAPEAGLHCGGVRLRMLRIQYGGLPGP